MADLTITERRVGNDVVILDCEGKITLKGEGSKIMRDRIRKLVAEGEGKILLNMAGVQYIDSSGIGELVSSFTVLKKEKGNFKLLALTQGIQDLLAITRLLTVFQCFNNEKDGIASFDKPKPAK